LRLFAPPDHHCAESISDIINHHRGFKSAEHSMIYSRFSERVAIPQKRGYAPPGVQSGKAHKPVWRVSTAEPAVFEPGDEALFLKRCGFTLTLPHVKDMTAFREKMQFGSPPGFENSLGKIHASVSGCQSVIDGVHNEQGRQWFGVRHQILEILTQPWIEQPCEIGVAADAV
jgi:hypothetical protein